MAITFNPPTTGLDCEAAIALDADLSADPSTWAFTDITGYVRWRDGISVTTGRPDEASRVDAGHAEMRLDNRDGRFSRRNPLGAYYGQLTRNTPIRLRIHHDAISDTFTRSASNGWGSASSGQAYTVASTASDFSVTGTRGRMSLGSVAVSRRAWLEEDLADYDAQFSFIVSSLASGAQITVMMMGRYDSVANNAYRLSIGLRTDQSVTIGIDHLSSGTGITLAGPTVVGGLTHTITTVFSAKMQLTRNTIRGKVWDSAAGEPASWQVAATDTTLVEPGAIGFRAVLETGNTTALPVLAEFDDFTADGYYTPLEQFVNEWPARWDKSRRDATVPIKCAGIMRRLTQGTPPSLSPLARTIASYADANLVAYWPCEDDANATFVASGLPNDSAMVVQGAPVFADYDPDATPSGTFRHGTAPLVNLQNGGKLIGVVDDPDASGTQWAVMWFSEWLPTVSEVRTVAEWLTPGGTYVRWQFVINGAGGGSVIAYDAANNPTTVLNSGDIVTGLPNFTITAKQNGINADVTLNTGGNLDDSQTLASIDVASITAFTFNPNGSTTTNSFAVGHAQVWATATPPTFDGNSTDSYGESVGRALSSYQNEVATDRLTRMCSELGIPLVIDTVAAGDEIRMGPQLTNTFLELAREVEAAEGGVLYEVGFGLGYQSRAVRENAAVVFNLDFSSGHVSEPPEPADDDQRYRNRWTASRSAGSSSTVEDTDLVTLDQAYADSVTVNVIDDTLLPDQAGWRLHLSTVDEDRWPSISINFASTGGRNLIESWAALGYGARMELANPPSQVDTTPISAFIEGKVEEFTPFDWDAVINTTPARPFDVGVIAADSGDTSSTLARLAADDSTLFAAITSSATTMSVKPGGVRWTTASDDFTPNLRIIVGGEIMDISNIVNAPTFVNVGTAAHADNASVVPGLPAGLTAGDLMILFAAIRGTVGTGVDLPAGWSSAGSFNNLRLMYRTATSSEAAPTVTFSGGAVGDTTSAQICAFRGVSTGLPINVTQQSNGSAQDIAYPGVTPDVDCVVAILFGWKQDDFTSAAPPAGFTEIAEASTVTGNDQSLYWAYQIQTARAAMVAGSIVVTGGAAAVSRAGILTIYGLQTFTVASRSVNSVVKAHSAGDSVQVFKPLILTMGGHI